MIGPKKLSTIRGELQRALSATGKDPLRWLEERMAGQHAQGDVASGESEVLQCLKRLVESTQRGKRGKQRVGTKP